jgi:zinc protease
MPRAKATARSSAQPSVPELHWTEIDGVKTVWAQTQGPLSAGLAFRTGRADETLATSGTTHLLEHLALWRFMDQARASNGGVSAAHTTFVTTGEHDEVVRFMAGVCGALHSLPVDRLEREKQILTAEEATRRPEVMGSLLTRRYGVRGFGLMGVRELGFRAATMDSLQKLAQAILS